jgi:two-component system, OmpR family, aerobic respiration control sensor histidine kinase ArcB
LIKAKEEEAEAANNAKTEFLENMRHDIRTPLTGIVGFANLIAGETNEPKIKEYVDNLVASSNALHDLLNEILEVIKIGSRELPLLKKKFDIRKKMMEVIKLNQARAFHKHLALEFKYDENLPSYVIGDSTRLHRIALELLTNALNFTDKGLVKLTVEQAKRTENKLLIRIIVEDTGIGIPLDKQEEIFVQFKKLTPSYKGIYKGAGLGLTIIKEFINDLEGEIYVESEEGKGNSMKISISKCLMK